MKSLRSVSAMFPLLSSVHVGSQTRPTWNKIWAPHTLFTMCCTCEPEPPRALKLLFPERHGYTDSSCQSTAMRGSSLNERWRRRVLMSFQSFIKGVGERSSTQLRLVCLGKYAPCHYSSWLYKDTIASKHSWGAVVLDRSTHSPTHSAVIHRWGWQVGKSLPTWKNKPSSQ